MTPHGGIGHICVICRVTHKVGTAHLRPGLRGHSRWRPGVVYHCGGSGLSQRCYVQRASDISEAGDSMSAVRSVLVGGACGLLLVTGCSAAAPKATMVSTSPPLVTASQSTSPSVSAEVGKSYLKALFSGEAGVMREGLKLTAPNSVAYHWLDHEANLAEGLPRVGDAVPKAVIAAASGDAFNECSGPAEDATCTTFGGFKVNGHGKLVDLTVNKQPIGPRLTVGRGQTVTAAATKFTLLTAYQSVVSGTWI